MTEMTIVKALITLGYESGWAANEHGITLWAHNDPQPTKEQLIAAGWIKPSEPTA